MAQENYDVAIIGSGLTSLCAAALLASGGYKTAVIEKLPQIGGRFSSIQYKGFTIPTGAVVVPTAGTLREVFEEVGADFNVVPLPPDRFRADGEEFEPPEKGVVQGVLFHLCREEKEVGRIMMAVRKAFVWNLPSNHISLRDWLLQYTKHEKALAYFEMMCQYMLGIGSHEASAQGYFDLLQRMRGAGSAGLAPKGQIQLAESLAAVMQSKGSDIWTDCSVKKIIVAGGTVRGVVMEKDGEDVEIAAKVVVSNADPDDTVEMAGRENFDRGYLGEIGRRKPAALMKLEIASDRPLHEAPNLMTIDARRMLNFGTLTLLSSELAPPGKHLAVAYGAIRSKNLRTELDLFVQDLKENIPLFTRYGEVFHASCYSGFWPVYRNAPVVNYPTVPAKTPVENLYNAGDAVLYGGTVSCAQVARMVVNDITRRHKPAAVAEAAS